MYVHLVLLAGCNQGQELQQVLEDQPVGGGQEEHQQLQAAGGGGRGGECWGGGRERESQSCHLVNLPEGC